MVSCITFTLLTIHSINKFKLLLYSLGTLLLFNYYFGFLDYYIQISFSKFNWWEPDIDIYYQSLPLLNKYGCLNWHNEPIAKSKEYNLVFKFKNGTPYALNQYAHKFGRLKRFNFSHSHKMPSFPFPEFYYLPKSNTQERKVSQILPTKTLFEVTILVKSARNNIERRNAIRRTWGKQAHLYHYPRQKNHPTSFVSDNIKRLPEYSMFVRTVFLVGLNKDEHQIVNSNTPIDKYETKTQNLMPFPPSTLDPLNLQNKTNVTSFHNHDNNLKSNVFKNGSNKMSANIKYQSEIDDRHNDMVVGNFIDHYYNNTLKVLLGLRWYFSLESKLYEPICHDNRLKKQNYGKYDMVSQNRAFSPNNENNMKPKKRISQSSSEPKEVADLVILIDDDYYFNPHNLLRYLIFNVTTGQQSNYTTTTTTSSNYIIQKRNAPKLKLKRNRFILPSIEPKVPQNSNNFMGVMQNSYDYKIPLSSKPNNPNNYAFGTDMQNLRDLFNQPITYEQMTQESERILNTVTNGAKINAKAPNQINQTKTGLISSNISSRAITKNQTIDQIFTKNNLDDNKNVFSNIYTGYVFAKNTPHRIRFSKWFIGVDEYPYDAYPPYVTGGVIMLSKDVARYFYEMAPITKLLPFDDVYFGIMALKLKIAPTHNPDFMMFPPPNMETDLADRIACHGFHDPNRLLDIWQLYHKESFYKIINQSSNFMQSISSVAVL